VLTYIPPELPMSVVFIGYKDSAGISYVMGSAFWVVNIQKEEDLKKEYRPAYLVTAAHVIDEIKKHANRVWLRVNVRGNGADWFSVGSVDDWKNHPDASVDISILKVGIESQWDHFGWGTDSLVTETTIKEDEKEIEIGDEVFTAGLFWPHKGRSKNIPIVRVGNIAAVREEKIELRKGLFSDLYLMEVRSVGGLSGSPVFIDIVNAKDYKRDAGNIRYGARFRVIGVLTGHFKGSDSESISMQIPESELDKLNMGIAYLTPAEKIIEGLEQFMSQEKKEIEDHRKKKFAFVSLDASTQTPNIAAQITPNGFGVPIPSRDEFFDDLKKPGRKKN